MIDLTRNNNRQSVKQKQKLITVCFRLEQSNSRPYLDHTREASNATTATLTTLQKLHCINASLFIIEVANYFMNYSLYFINISKFDIAILHWFDLHLSPHCSLHHFWYRYILDGPRRSLESSSCPRRHECDRRPPIPP